MLLNAGTYSTLAISNNDTFFNQLFSKHHYQTYTHSVLQKYINRTNNYIIGIKNTKKSTIYQHLSTLFLRHINILSTRLILK